MRSTKWWRWFLGLILLTALCIGGTELAVCRFADPVLYQQITSPIRRKAADLRDETAALAAAAWDTLSYAREQMTEALRRGEDVSLEDQAADSPVEAEVPPAADPAITSLKDRGGQEILTGGSREIIYYNQSDPEWSDQPYGSDTLGKYGCGPVSMAMAVSSLTEQTTDPAEIAQWAVDNGHWARHGGSYLSIVSGVAENYGLSVESVPDCDAERLILELSSGKIAVALMTKGHFTNGGHFILLRGSTLDGSILVADPNSRERSLSPWDAQLILDELSASHSSGAPLWFLSPDK